MTQCPVRKNLREVVKLMLCCEFEDGGAFGGTNVNSDVSASSTWKVKRESKRMRTGKGSGRERSE